MKNKLWDGVRNVFCCRKHSGRFRYRTVFFTLLVLSCLLHSFLFLVSANESTAADGSDQSGVMTAALPLEELPVDSGAITDTVSWSLSEDEQGIRTLSIKGEGPMAAYKSESEQPWRTYAESINRLKIEDGITRIEAYCFNKMSFSEVSIGKDVEYIGRYAFGYGSNLSSITIPGNVKRIEDQAFVFHFSLEEIFFEEGVEEIGNDAFGSQKAVAVPIHLPSSLKKMGEMPFWNVSGYTVGEANTEFQAVDGILYTKDMTVLKDFPKKKPTTIFRVPETVLEIGASALSRVQMAKKLYIPSNVQKMQKSYMTSRSSWEEIYIEDGVPLSCSGTFYANSKLTEVRLPENTDLEEISNTVGYGCTSLLSFKIPDGTKKVTMIGNPLTSLESLIYDAKDAVLSNKSMIDPSIYYDLTIGEHVDCLPEEFRWFVPQADRIILEPENSFYVEAGAFDGAEEPFASLEGWVYVDHQGIIYRYDKETLDAYVVSFQGGISDLTIPDRICPEEGVECPVIGIEKKAFFEAAGIKTITFISPDNIKSIGTYAFFGCTGLTVINDKNTVGEVEGLFTAAGEIGYRAFYNTGLLDSIGTGNFESEMEGTESLSVTREGTAELIIMAASNGGTMVWQGEERGGYRLLTGDTMTVTISTGNISGTDEYRYRVYFERTSEDGIFSIEPGNTYTFDGQEVSCGGTEDMNTVYVEFSPEIGKSVSIPVTVVYPSPDSSGGGVRIWGRILKEGETEESHFLSDEEMRLEAFWTTKADLFQVSKKSSGSANVLLKGMGDGLICPEKNMEWLISFGRAEEEVLPYGKDYVKSVDFKDTLFLPEGFYYTEDMISAIEAGEVRRSGNDFYVGTTKIGTLRFTGSAMNLTKVYFSLGEDGNPVLSWTLANKTRAAEIGSAQIYLTFYPAAFYADMRVLDLSAEPSVTNKVEAHIHYRYEEDALSSSEASKGISAGSASLSLTKTSPKKEVYFGEEITYTIQLSNPGAYPYTAEEPGSWMLKDQLDSYTYLTVPEMEILLKQYENLTIGISGADLIPWELCQGIMLHSSAWKNSYNSGNNGKETEKDSLTLSWRGETEEYYVQCGEDGYAGPELDALLKSAGYEVTHWASYTLMWEMNGAEELFCLLPGEKQIYSVTVRMKDTFSMVTRDEETFYPIEEAINLKNYVSLVDSDGQNKKQASTDNKMKREAYIRQEVWEDEKQLEQNFTAEHGSILTYQPVFTHYGTGDYKNLPMVDEIYGAQALLVPVNNNPQLDSFGFETVTVEEEEHYVLTEGTYHNVAAGISEDGNTCIAHEIIVEKKDTPVLITFDGKEILYSGLHTTIKWYYPALEGGRYFLKMKFHTRVDQGLTETGAYTLANTVWMNDRELSRIYSVVYGGGTIIDFDKEIVEEKGELPSEDVIREEDFSMICPGEQVTYRLTLRPKGEGICSVTGADLYDRLPANGEIFAWEKGVNIDLSYVSTHDSTGIEGITDWTVSETLDDMEEAGQQYLLWNEEMQITFYEKEAAVCFYVTLTFPEHDGTDASLWSAYAKSLDGIGLTNTFYVYRYPARVSHHLYEEGRVLLQKGVYGMSYTLTDGYGYSESRIYYNNKDNKARQIMYYVLLYNGGNKKLYLNDLYDRLPEGFTYSKLSVDSVIKTGTKNEIKTLSDFGGNSFVEENLLKESGGMPCYKNAGVQLVADTDGILRMRFSAGEGEDAVSYDQEKQRYYLSRNEAILFGYLCDIGTSEETKVNPCNGITMEYTDYLNSGLTSELDEIRFCGVDDEIHIDQNDGDCNVKTFDEIKETFNLAEEEAGQIWLLSEAVLHRGQAVPGITKYTDSYQAAGSDNKTEYLYGAGPYDTVNWRVRIHNSGTLALSDYVLVERMPDPYVFTGDVVCAIYDYQGRILESFTLASIGDYQKEDESVEIKTNDGTTKNLIRDGSKTDLAYRYGTKAYLSMTGEEGEERCILHFFDGSLSIPEGGFMDVAFSSKNPTTTFQNTVYINQALVVPMKQEISFVSHGSLTKWDGKDAVINSAPVNISFGYATGSEKEAKLQDTETASGSGEKNSLVLPSKESEFTYSLIVSNDTEKAMEKLVVIDQLPCPGDTNPFHEDAKRNSEFTVEFAGEQKLQVAVTKEDGTSISLNENQYRVEYGKSRTLTKEDWSGDSLWEETSEKRMIRVCITDPDGQLIPAKSKVEISFQAVPGEDALSGKTAWNSFGYHYKLCDVTEELEAMPLPVGVRMYETPSLKKELVSGYGIPTAAEKDLSYRFYLYEGSPIGTGQYSEEELLAALETEGISSQKLDLTVRKGETVSEEMELNFWNWEDGKTYTLTEIKNENNGSFVSFNGMAKEHYSFTYQMDEKTQIICRNKLPDWKILIVKKDREDNDKTLQGAQFALYGKESEGEAPEGIESTVTVHSETFYYCRDGITDENGLLEWKDLYENEYYLMEIKAPDGYDRMPEGIHLYRSDLVDGILEVEIENQKGIMMPETGGMGTGLFYAAGLALLLFTSAVCKKRKGEWNK